MKVKISVIKFDEVNGKRTNYKSFAFELDPKEMAQYKTEATVRKGIEEFIVKSGVFKRDEVKKLKYSMKDFLEEWKKEVEIAQKEEQAKLEESENNPCSRITPETITQLAPNEIFVFGSNASGEHFGGAAKYAAEHFGAIMGQGHGLQGMSYAIDSMSGINAMKADVIKFIKFAKDHPQKTFFVTLIGCGIAGYDPSDVATLFEDCRDLNNVCLPQDFWDIIGFPEETEPAYDLERFVEAQYAEYETILEELKDGHKLSHWIWYIFPQQKGLGHSYNSQYYGLDGTDEAKAYLAHPILGKRLRECCKVLLSHKGELDIYDIMGSNIDVKKLETSMNLFDYVAPNDVFKKVLDAFF